ncbi:17633_t:CDS:2 [Cetraspora pellucida]|uniref:17633_t:CDS:1 n=1 Tax=Cetraspora pellucida TaxID=1433469 RepID=A0A9N8VXK5_9GLOM|nr:17633_t:CDS:2 [Cetraspora pellucida]
MVIFADDRIEGPYSTSEYRQEFYVEGTVLMCRACRIALNHKKKSVLDDHLISIKHQVAKTAANNPVPIQVQQNINATRLSEREQMNLNLVQALTAADIPLEKLDNDTLKEFFKKYCKFEKYLSMLYDLELDKLHETLLNQQICITVDESTDACSRAAVNILFSFGNKTKLVATKHLKKVDATTISQVVMSTVQLYNIPYENVRLYISDNAAYIWWNMACKRRWISHLSFNAITMPLLPPCFDSSLDTNLGQNENLNTITTTLPPLSIKTHWNSWFKFIFWINQYLPFLITFYQEEKNIDNSSAAIQELAQFACNNTLILKFEILVLFITSNAQSMHDPLLDMKLIEKCISNGIDLNSYKLIFCEAYKLAWNKFKKHIDRHNVLSLFRAIRCFDSKFIQAQNNRHSLDNYKEIDEFLSPTNNLIDEWEIYYFAVNFNKYDDQNLKYYLYAAAEFTNLTVITAEFDS